MGRNRIYSWGAAGVLLLLAACRTTPMYHEGDVHLENVCQKHELEACFKKLKKVCERDFTGTVINAKELTVDDNLLHVVCRPSEKAKEEADKKKTSSNKNAAEQKIAAEKKNAAEQKNAEKDQNKSTSTAPQKSPANENPDRQQAIKDTK